MNTRVSYGVILAVITLGLMAPSGVWAQEMMTLPAGTRIIVATDTPLHSGESKTGESFTTTLLADLAIYGVVVARQGDHLYGRIIDAKKAGRVVRKANLSFELTELNVNGRTYPLVTHPYGIEGDASGDVKKIAIKAGLGEVIGGAAMAKRMAISGTAVAILTPGKQIEIPTRSWLEFYLAQPASLPALANPVILDPGQMATQFTQAKGANAQILTQYRWISEVTFAVKGETKASTRMLVQFENGKLKVEPIGVQQEDKKRGIRGRIQKKKKSKMEEMIEGITHQIQAYAMMPPDQANVFFQSSWYSPSGGDMNGTVLFQAIGVLDPNDWVALWVDMATYRSRRLMVRTLVGEDWVQAEIDYRTLDDGTSYPFVIEFFLPGKQIAGTVANADFTR